MYKNILALTLAGSLAIPFAFGHQADAASQSRPSQITIADWLNPMKLKDEQSSKLSEILKSLGISIDFNQLLASNSPTTTAKKATADNAKENCPTAAKDKNNSQAASAAPKAVQPAASSPAKPAAKPSGSSSSAVKPANPPASNSQMNAFENQVVTLTNQQRVKAGLKPLKTDNATLSRMARDKSADMRDKNYFDHQSPTFGSPFDMMKKYGISYSYAGENIAAGQKTPEDVVNGWMNSPGHRANILNPNFTTIGVGYVSGGSYGSYWTQEFIGK